MSLLDVDNIDYIGVNILYKRVFVGIFDDLAWDDEARHFALLTKKIDRYTQYIRSGQLLSAYPQVRGYPVIFEYVAMRPMTRSAEAFWKTRESLIRATGYEVRFRTVDVRPAPQTEIEEIADAPVVENAPVETMPAAAITAHRAEPDTQSDTQPGAQPDTQLDHAVHGPRKGVLVLRKKASSGR
jgi:hypothetical protein